MTSKMFITTWMSTFKLPVNGYYVYAGIRPTTSLNNDFK